MTGSQDTSSGEHTQTLAVDSGLGANQIVQLNGDGRLPAIDGSLLTNLPGGGGGGSSLNIQDEGTALSTAATTLNFVGAGVTASGTGATKTITINGGSGSGYSDSDVDLHLNQSGPTPGYVLTWNGSDYAWTANGTGSGLGDMVDDTTPQLGGNLDLNGNDIVTGANRVTFADSGVCSFMDFTVTHFGQNNNTVLSSVKSINMFLDSNGGDSGQAFRIYNNIDPDTATTESDYIFKVEEDGDVVIKGTFRSEQAGAPIMTSASSLTLQATTRTSIANTPLQLESFTTSARDALTTADGESQPTERLRIDSLGRVGINTDTHPDTSSALSITNGQTGSDHCILDIRCNDNETSRIYFSEVSTSANGSIRYRYTGDDNYMSFYTNGSSSSEERLRITKLGHISIISGNLEFANGAGIDFSNVPDGSRSIDSDGNKLDDYEEGSFTPYYYTQNSLLTAGYISQDGKYTKIGRFVHFQIYLRLSSKSGGSGHLRIYGLPFTSSSATGAAYGGGVVAYTNNWDNDTIDRIMVGSGSDQVQLFVGQSSGTNVNAGAGNLNSDTQLRIFGSYQV